MTDWRVPREVLQSIADGNPTEPYVQLQWLESNGLVTLHDVTPTAGPARILVTLTGLGQYELDRLNALEAKP